MFEITKYIQDSINTKQKILKDHNLLNKIEKISNIIVSCYKNGNKVMIAGNGGSAADAQHFAGELVSKFFFDRPGLSAFSLSTDTSILTAIGNDYGYEHLFSRQVQANGKKGDVFIGISTSGNSKNIVSAINQAKTQGITTVGLVGQKECEMDKICDHIIKVPSYSTPTIQESQLMIEHIICAKVEEKIFHLSKRNINNHIFNICKKKSK